MTATVRRSLYSLYYQHGLITFLLMFVPILPGVVETHTKAYLGLLKLFAGDYKDSRTAIRVVFGRRGLKAFEQYILNHKAIIRPGQIFRCLYQLDAPRQSLHLLRQMFLDLNQRTHPLSHQYRATLALEAPFIMQWATKAHHPKFRHQFTHLLTQAIKLEQAPETRQALIDALDQIHLLAQADHRRQQSALLNAELNCLETKLKINLTQPTAIYSMPQTQAIKPPILKPLLSPNQTHHLHLALTAQKAFGLNQNQSQFAPHL